MCAYKKQSKNFTLDPATLFSLAVKSMEIPGDWKIKNIDGTALTAHAITPMSFSHLFGNVVTIRVSEAKGLHTQKLSNLTVKSHPRFGIGGAMDTGGQNANNVHNIMEQVVTFFNNLELTVHE